MIRAEETGLGVREEKEYGAHAGALDVCVCVCVPAIRLRPVVVVDLRRCFSPCPEDREPRVTSPPKTVHQVHLMPISPGWRGWSLPVRAMASESARRLVGLWHLANKLSVLLVR